MPAIRTRLTEFPHGGLETLEVFLKDADKPRVVLEYIPETGWMKKKVMLLVFEDPESTEPTHRIDITKEIT